MTAKNPVDEAGEESFPASDATTFHVISSELPVVPSLYVLPPLAFDYNSLEPVIDEETMHLHHDKHHRAYVAGLNKGLDGHPEWSALPIDDLMRRLSDIPKDIHNAVRNQGGGHANHALFWRTLTPHGHQEPGGALAEAIVREFGSLSAFKAAFKVAGVSHFGSGWVFLSTDPNSNFRLSIVALPNQDTPLSSGSEPLLACDLWEHAYYLKYNNRRADWLDAFWDVVDWRSVGDAFDRARDV